jgi:HK97 family phage major capsid protein
MPSRFGELRVSETLAARLDCLQGCGGPRADDLALDATKLTADGLINAVYALKPFYRNRAMWVCNGSTIATLRKLQVGTGNYLFPGLNGTQDDRILGLKIVECPDLPDVAAGTFPLVLVDFASGYRIYDRVGISLLRDPYRSQ